MSISSQLMNRNNYLVVLEEIIKGGNIKRKKLPVHFHTLLPPDQVSSLKVDQSKEKKYLWAKIRWFVKGGTCKGQRKFLLPQTRWVLQGWCQKIKWGIFSQFQVSCCWKIIGRNNFLLCHIKSVVEQKNIIGRNKFILPKIRWIVEREKRRKEILVAPDNLSCWMIKQRMNVSPDQGLLTP